MTVARGRGRQIAGRRCLGSSAAASCRTAGRPGSGRVQATRRCARGKQLAKSRRVVTAGAKVRIASRRERVLGETWPRDRVNLRTRFVTIDATICESPTMVTPGSADGIESSTSRFLASNVAAISISSRSDAREMRSVRGAVASSRTSASDRLTRSVIAARLFATRLAVLPPGATLPERTASNASVAVLRRLRSSWARNPRCSTPRRMIARSLWRAYSVTASVIAMSRQRFNVRKSSFVISGPSSTASSVIAWQMFP